MLLKDCYIGDYVKIDGCLADGCNTELIRNSARGIVITKDKYERTIKNISGWDPSWHDDEDIGYIESYDRIFVVNNTCEVTLIKPVKKYKTIKDNEETKMKDVKIVDYKVYNDKVVVVWFDDGTSEKATCNEEDNFDLSHGVEIACLKHMYGAENYKAMLKDFMNQIKAVDKAKEDKKNLEELIARKRAKNERRKARTRANRRAERVSEMKEAYLKAMNEYNKTRVLDSEILDDLK